MPQFTSENARENAARSHESRRARKLASMEVQISRSQMLQPDPAIASPEAAFGAFALERLNRIKRHLQRLDAMLDLEKDPQCLVRLAND